MAACVVFPEVIKIGYAKYLVGRQEPSCEGLADLEQPVFAVYVSHFSVFERQKMVPKQYTADLKEKWSRISKFPFLKHWISGNLVNYDDFTEYHSHLKLSCKNGDR